LLTVEATRIRQYESAGARGGKGLCQLTLVEREQYRHVMNGLGAGGVVINDKDATARPACGLDLFSPVSDGPGRR